MTSFFSRCRDISALKIAAVMSMTVDHVSLYLFSNNIYGRFVGRFAFPLFAAILAHNYLQHYDGGRQFPRSYVTRLLSFGFVAQVAYTLLGRQDLNILYTLAVGLLLMHTYYKKSYFEFVLLLVAVLLVNHYVVSVEYGVPGSLLPLALSLSNKLPLAVVSLYLAMLQYDPCAPLIMSNSVSILKPWSVMFGVGTLLAVLLAAVVQSDLQPSKKGSDLRHKYFFYVFYPAHLAVISVLRLIW